MLKNLHIVFCSFMSFVLMNLFFMQEKGTISLSLGFDSFSVMLAAMTIICLIMVAWLTSNVENSLNLTYINICMFFIFMFLFLTENFFHFYIMFELSVLPMMFYIASWGYSLDRIKAMMYMFLYTFFFSLPFVMIMIYVSFSSNVNLTMAAFSMTEKSVFIAALCLVMFLVKVPVWGLHLWLPKAHVEASTEGSMILAGIVLKLAGIGMIKYSSLYFINTQSSMMIFFCSLSMIGAFSMGLYCTRQSDAKVIIALSSIVHMSFLFLCYMMGSIFSFNAMLIVMVSHGIVSPLMFMFLGEVYNVLSSRCLQHLKGVLKNVLYMSLIWFVVCMFNMGLPLSMNFFGEMMFFFSSVSFSQLVTLFLATLIFINGFFNSFLLIFMTGGQEKEYLYAQFSLKSISMLYYSLLFIILFTFMIIEI